MGVAARHSAKGANRDRVLATDKHRELAVEEDLLHTALHSIGHSFGRCGFGYGLECSDATLVDLGAGLDVVKLEVVGCLEQSLGATVCPFNPSAGTVVRYW